MNEDGQDREFDEQMKQGRMARLIGTLVILAAACATAPILLHGAFCGDDFEFHVVSWFDVHQSWLHGILIPHWLESVNYGAGEPRFMFYPPLSWILGGAMGFLLPWRFVPVAMVFVLLAATGFAVRKLAREALAEGAATLAGCFALCSAYALFSAYERTAYAEMTGGFLIPLLLLYALRDRCADRKLWGRMLDGSTVPLALVVAGCWLSDGPLGVMGSYLLAGVATGVALLARSWAPFLRAVCACVLGLMLTGAYLIPAAWEQAWADLWAAVDYPVFRIENNWLFGRNLSGPLSPFAVVLERASVIAACMMAATMVAGVILLVRRRHAGRRGGFELGAIAQSVGARRWLVLIAIPAGVLFLLLPVSLPVWYLLPKLRFLQYPWRWVLVLEAPMGFFVGAALWPWGARVRTKALIAVGCAAYLLASTALCAHTFLRTCKEGDTVADLLQLFRSEGGLEGTDEYEPPDSDHWKIATGLPDACFTADANTTLGVAASPNAVPEWNAEQGSCFATAHAAFRDATRLRVSLAAPQNGFVVLRLLNYPAWRVLVNGKATDPADERDDGLLAVPVAKGTAQIDVNWKTTGDVIAGRCVTGVALLLLVGLGIVERRLSRRRRE